MQVNEKCDVYSFAVLALEIIMGKHPGDIISSFFCFLIGIISSFMSPSTAPVANNLLLIDILDQRLPHPTNPIVEEVILIARLAFSCLRTRPHSRPTMDQVSKALVIGRSPLVDQFPLIRLGQLH